MMVKRVSLEVCALVIFCLTLSIIACGGEPPSGTANSDTKMVTAGTPIPTPHNCTSCHKFDEAKFQEMMGEKKVTVVTSEMVLGFWQVLYEDSPGHRAVIYTSPTYDSVFYGQLLGKHGKNYTRDYMLAHAAKVDTSTIPVRDAVIVMGNKEAKNKIIVFDDLECPYCARLHFELKSFLADHKDYGVYVMLFPLAIHPKSEEKSKAVYCMDSLKAKEEAVEGLFKGIIENKKVELAEEKKCDISGLEQARQYAVNTLKLKGTPFMVLPDGRVVDGFVSKQELEEIIAGKVMQQPSPSVPAKEGGA